MGRRRIVIVGMTVALALLGLASPAHASGGGHGAHHHASATVKVRDDCDPKTFNRPPAPAGQPVQNGGFGPGTCVKRGHTTIGEVFRQFTATGAVRGWDFTPYRVHVRAGGTIKAVNVGGEFHTFTKVTRFGGGCLPLLNARPKGQKALTPVKECGGVTFDPAKGTVPKVFGPTGLKAGETKSFTAGRGKAHVERYECLIHPWMRAVAYVDSSHSSSGHSH